MLDGQDLVLAGVSGGADSVCLLFVLLDLQEEIGFRLQAVHVNHGIRGAAADADEQSVKDLCARVGVPLRVYHEDVPGYARAHGLTEEEAGRQVRQACLTRRADEIGATRIAVAHSASDNVETLLFNLCRGTDLTGLGGMQPVNGRWIRPLLCVDRAQIEAYLSERQIPYRIDESNNTDTYTRNKIRHHVIPYLKEEINEKSESHMARTMEQMRTLNDYVEAEVDRYQRLCVQEEAKGLLIRAADFAQVPEALSSYVLYRALTQAAGRKKDVEAVHVRMMEDLMAGPVGHHVDLPYQVRADRRYEGLYLSTGKAAPGTGSKEQAGRFTTRIFEKPKTAFTIPRNAYTKWFDYDIIKHTVEMRHRKPGDYITINRQGGTQKVKQYMINEKIPREKRDQIWLAADGSHIMWIVGYRQNQAYQVTSQTRRILEIVYREGEPDG